MNYRGILKLLFVIITCLISAIFIIFQCSSSVLYYPANYLYFIPIGILVVFAEINKKKPFKKHKKKIFLLVIFLNIGLILSYCYALLMQYLKFHYIDSNILFYYEIMLLILLIRSLFDCFRETYFLNDLLVMITCLVITLVIYRYEVDPIMSIVESSSHYVTQYVGSFMGVLFLLLIQKSILEIKEKKL